MEMMNFLQNPISRCGTTQERTNMRTPMVKKMAKVYEKLIVLQITQRYPAITRANLTRHSLPARRNNDVIITSKRRHDAVLML